MGLYKRFLTMMKTVVESSSFENGKKRRNELIAYEGIYSM